MDQQGATHLGEIGLLRCTSQSPLEQKRPRRDGCQMEGVVEDLCSCHAKRGERAARAGRLYVARQGCCLGEADSLRKCSHQSPKRLARPPAAELSSSALEVAFTDPYAPGRQSALWCGAFSKNYVRACQIFIFLSSAPE